MESLNQAPPFTQAPGAKHVSELSTMYQASIPLFQSVVTPQHYS